MNKKRFIIIASFLILFGCISSYSLSGRRETDVINSLSKSDAWTTDAENMNLCLVSNNDGKWFVIGDVNGIEVCWNFRIKYGISINSVAAEFYKNVSYEGEDIHIPILEGRAKINDDKLIVRLSDNDIFEEEVVFYSN